MNFLFLATVACQTLSCLRDARSWDLSNIAYLRAFEIKSPRSRGKTFACAKFITGCVSYLSIA
jgi:hypothetical protein